MTNALVDPDPTPSSSPTVTATNEPESTSTPAPTTADPPDGTTIPEPSPDPAPTEADVSTPSFEIPPDAGLPAAPQPGGVLNPPTEVGPPVSAAIEPATGGILRSSDGSVSVEFPAWVAKERLAVSVKPLERNAPAERIVVRRFELNALAQDRGNAPVQAFDKPVKLTVRLAPAELRHLNPASVDLYWRDEAQNRWVLVPSEFDPARGLLSAEMTHFSEYSLQTDPGIAGPGMIQSFQNDLHSGAATASYPIELPPGPRGFQPSLSLTYNSGILDSMKSEYGMAGWVGLGWNLSMGSIAEGKEEIDGNPATKFLELNGVGHELIKDSSGKWHTRHESYYRIETEVEAAIPPNKPEVILKWKIWDKDGVYYEFGGSDDSLQYVWA